MAKFNADPIKVDSEAGAEFLSLLCRTQSNRDYQAAILLNFILIMVEQQQ